ncbi:MAG: NADH-quinone oxidoreductase subunit K [Myxococcota bacterium]|jgi:NADH-quinone oxidoreductase subunit K
MPIVPIDHYLILAAILFSIGAAGVMTRRNALVILMSVELMLNAANLTFLAFARMHGDNTGHVMVFFVIAVAAAEAAVGLAIVLNVFRHKRTVNVDDIRALKG